MTTRARVRAAVAAMVGVVVTTGVLGSGSVAARGAGTSPTTSVQAPRAVDARSALDTSGTFRGRDGLSGTLNPAEWTLVSNLATGEAPRFQRTPRSTGPATLETWSSVGSNGNTPALNGEVLALTPSSSHVYLGGDFYNTVGALSADSLAAWDGSSLSAVGSNNSIPSTVSAIAVSGNDLYIGGAFSNAGGLAHGDNVIKWNGATSSWSALGPGLNEQVRALAVSGNDVYAGGDFYDVDGDAEADHVARWDGANWSALGSFNNDGAIDQDVHALVVSGGLVYAGGLFTNAGGHARADYIAKWDGAAWSAMGSDGLGEGALSREVDALVMYGGILYVGGDFEDAANIQSADFVAKWSGGAWHGLGSDGTDGAITNRVYALAMSGSDLYAGGFFLDAMGDPEMDHVAKWDGNAWSALGSNGGGNGAIDNTVYSLGVFDGNLYVGGLFLNAGGIVSADYVASWGLPPVLQPDLRVRVGTSGAWIGDGIYNFNGDHQRVTSQAARGSTITYQISVQNDSPMENDSFTVGANTTVNADYTVKYFKGSINITADVEAGTYQTSVLAPGATYKIKVTIKVKNSAPVGSQVTRKVTVTSNGDATKRDKVKVVGQRS